MLCKAHKDRENIIKNARDCLSCESDLRDAMATAQKCGDSGSLVKNEDGYYEYVKGPDVSPEEIREKVNAYFAPLCKMAKEIDEMRARLYGHHRTDDTPQ